MKTARPALRLERLDERALPTTFGVPWADPSHLTLSFAPDGTETPYGASSLSGLPAAYQREVLRAFQTWAVNANIDIGLIDDGGQPLGTTGAVQGDTRFGDVRIAAAPLSPSLVGSAAPFSFSGTTLSGDLVLNRSLTFRVGNVAGTYDVFSTALHEAGHVFGLDHSDAAGSAVGERYAYRTTLSAGDIAHLRELYGARTPDRFDASGSNNTLGSADWLPTDALLANRLSATGDLTTRADVDFYKFNVLPLVGVTGVSVRLQAAGLSLLAPSLTIYDKYGRVVASARSTDPTSNDLSVRFTAGLFGATYYVKVDGATTDVFAVGGYRVAVDYLTLGTILAPLSPLTSPILDLHTDDLVGQLLSPLDKPAPDARFDFTFRGVIEDGHDIDRFRVFAPAAGPLHLNVMTWALETGGLDPRLQVYDATRGTPVAFQVLANDNGLMSLQIPDARPGTEYVVTVSARTPGDMGSYFLAIDFNQFALTEFEGVSEDHLSAGASDTGRLKITQAGVYEFALAAQGLSGGVAMTVYDAAGRTVFTLTADVNRPLVTTVRYLAEGTYTVRYTSRSAAEVQYQLFLYQVSEGAGPYQTSTGSSTSPPPPPPEGSSGSGGYTYDGSSSTRPSGSPYYF